MKRGRPAKPKMTQEELEDEVIYKYLHRKPMTLEESAMALYMYDKAHPIPNKKPKLMTKMGMLKLEQRILLKLRNAFEKKGLSKEDFLEFLSSKDNSDQEKYSVSN